MFDLPPHSLHAVELRRSSAFVVGTSESFPTGIAEVMPACALHVSAPLGFLNDLPTLLALPEFLHRLKIYRHFYLALSFVRDLQAIHAMLSTALKANAFFLELAHEAAAAVCLAGEEIRITDDLVVIFNLSQPLTLLPGEEAI
jgi:hypothetical protein